MAETLSFRVLTETHLPQIDTVQLLQDFLEVAFHTILHLREIYPPELFHQRKKYGVPIYQSRNPALNEYLGRIVECIGEELTKGYLRRVALVVKEASIEETPLERFVFDFEWLIPDKDFPTHGADWTPAKDGLAVRDVEDYMRRWLLKLNAAESYLLRLPPEVTFAVVVELKDDAPAPESIAASKGEVPAEWVPAEQRFAPGGDDEMEHSRKTVAPINTSRLGMVNVQLLVEELEAKFVNHEQVLAERQTVEVLKGKGKERARTEG